MRYSSGLEYIIRCSYYCKPYSSLNYFSKNTDDSYNFAEQTAPLIELHYSEKTASSIQSAQYNAQQYHSAAYIAPHSFTPEFFLKPFRQRIKIINDNDEVNHITEEIFEFMMKQKLPSNVSITILPFNEFKALHSGFGIWSNGILGFSLNGDKKKIFVKENHFDSLILVIGHEIGHVLTTTLQNKHDEEAKAFAFSIEWAKTIKKHNVANLGLSIKDEFDLQPAKNGLHDVAFAFVDFMVKKGRKALELHDDLVKKYVSVFNRVYC
ncbi:hypothetical protein HYY70_03035 [Candidatus Woesearchaeota archaeon]|nr:hypothetical protein [Candidatus Woesearchaeota archaeon]